MMPQKRRGALKGKSKQHSVSSGYLKIVSINLVRILVTLSVIRGQVVINKNNMDTKYIIVYSLFAIAYALMFAYMKISNKVDREKADQEKRLGK